MLMMGQLVKAVYAVAIAAVLVAALWPRHDQAQPVAVAQPSPSPQSIDFGDPALSQAVQHVRSFDVTVTAQWTTFCTETNGGTGYGAGNELICRAMQYR